MLVGWRELERSPFFWYGVFFLFYIGCFRLIDFSLVVLAVYAVVVFRRVGSRQKAFDLQVVHPDEHAGVVPRRVGRTSCV